MYLLIRITFYIQNNRNFITLLHDTLFLITKLLSYIISLTL